MVYDMSFWSIQGSARIKVARKAQRRGMVLNPVS
jgi:hypothetical protein